MKLLGLLIRRALWALIVLPIGAILISEWMLLDWVAGNDTEHYWSEWLIGTTYPR